MGCPSSRMSGPADAEANVQAAIGQRSASGTLLNDINSGLGMKQSFVLQERIWSCDPPTAALCPPGECQFIDEWSKATLVGRFQPTHDTMLLTFGLPDESRPLGLSTCACILAKFDPESVSEVEASPEPVVRPYTPVSTNAMIGEFRLLIKVYEHGAMTQHLMGLPLGAALDFKHTLHNVKVQYPFGKQHVTMIAGGVGITPMIQALHAILGTPGDTTRVTLIFSNKTQEDVLYEGLFASWSGMHPDRLRIVHVISRAAEDESCLGTTGHITREVIQRHSAPPSEDVLVMVCGPPAMYASLCGPRDKPVLRGLLRDMGYTAEQVVKL